MTLSLYSFTQRTSNRKSNIYRYSKFTITYRKINYFNDNDSLAEHCHKLEWSTTSLMDIVVCKYV